MSKKIELTQWLEFVHDYFADLQDKDIFDDKVRQEVNRRIQQLSSLEQMLFRTGQLEEPPDDFDASFQQLLEANRKLGRKVPEGKELERVRERVEKFTHGEAGFIFYNGDEQQAMEAAKKLAREKGLRIRKIESIRPKGGSNGIPNE